MDQVLGFERQATRRRHCRANEKAAGLSAAVECELQSPACVAQGTGASTTSDAMSQSNSNSSKQSDSFRQTGPTRSSSSERKAEIAHSMLDTSTEVAPISALQAPLSA